MLIDKCVDCQLQTGERPVFFSLQVPRTFLCSQVKNERSLIMAMKLAGALFKKAVFNLPFMSQKTSRVDSAEASQTYTWMFGGPDVVFEDPISKATLSIGSAKNAAQMEPADFDYVINCCPSDIAIHHARVRELDLNDTNTVKLEKVAVQLDDILREVRDVLQHERSRILCHCWMGASRSVAVATYLLCTIYGPTMGNAEEDFNHFYSEFKKHRKCISVSTTLKQQVCDLLNRQRNRPLGPRFTEQPAAAAATYSDPSKTVEKPTEKPAEKTAEKPAPAEKTVEKVSHRFPSDFDDDSDDLSEEVHGLDAAINENHMGR